MHSVLSLFELGIVVLEKTDEQKIFLLITFVLVFIISFIDRYFFPSTADLYSVTTLPHKAHSVTTTTETTATNEPEGVVLIKYCYIGNYL